MALTPVDPVGLLTTTTSAVQTVAGGDVTMTSLFSSSTTARRIYCNSGGNLAIKRLNDSAFVVYIVIAGAYIDGQILAVGGTGSGSTSGLAYIAEL